MKRVPDTLVTAMVIAVEVSVLLVLEARLPEREPRESRVTRIARNGVLGGCALAATGLLETPLVTRVATLVDRRGWGLLPRLRLPDPLRTFVTITALDYGIYVWHAAMHRVPALWRLHLVHHVDRDCDVSTALRIHALEIVLSVAVRVAQVVALGVRPGDFAGWQRLFGASVIFHHANVKLPTSLDRVLGAVVMTPRRHGIHHLATRDAQHGNWSSGLVIWDWVHGTLRDRGPATDIGVPAYRNAADVTLAKMIALPFVRQPDPWVAR